MIIDVQPCSGKDEQAASSNPGSGGSSTKEATPTDTPPAGESNSVSKTAESSSDNAEPMEHWPLTSYYCSTQLTQTH